MAWHIAIGAGTIAEKKFEAPSTETLLAWIREGRIPRESLVWREGMASWVKACEVRELAPAFSAASRGIGLLRNPWALLSATGVLLLFLSLGGFFLVRGTGGTLVLFDASHAQQVGNADWVIGKPPRWVGGFSDMAKVARNLGYRTESIEGPITASILSRADILVLPEPNTAYTPEEMRAIVDFVKGGGGLLMIADHIGSDRNNDGEDSVKVLNHLAPDAFAIRYNEDYLNDDPIPVSGSHPLLAGVKEIGTFGGCSIRPGRGATAVLPYEPAGKPLRVLIAASEPGEGRVVGVGDSSLFEDETGNPKADGSEKRLHPGVNQYDHRILARNIFKWLAEDGRGSDVPPSYTPLPDYTEVNEPPPWAAASAGETGSAPARPSPAVR